jgi:hypothetical protein
MVFLTRVGRFFISIVCRLYIVYRFQNFQVKEQHTSEMSVGSSTRCLARLFDEKSKGKC